jgi:signal transduction histidine kinase
VEASTRRAALIATAIALVVGVLLLGGDRYASERLGSAIGAAGATAFCAVAGIASARYLRGRDPHALFVAVGSAVIGIVGLIAVVVGAGDVDRVAEPSTVGVLASAGPLIENAVPPTMWTAAWAIGSIGFLLAVPWRERRGRPPVRPARVVVITVALTSVIASGIAIGLGDSSVDGTDPGPVAIAFAFFAAVALVVAGVREFRALSSSAPHPQLGVAWIVGALVPVSQIQGATFGMGLVRWVDAFAVVVPAIAIAGFLVADRREVTRMRRASDRAEEILGGRAEIASMIAHEVRGPVATIKGLAATTSGSYEKLSDDERREFVGLIEDEASRVLDVVEKTSLALKIDAGTLTFERRPHDLAAVVRDGIEKATVGDHPVTTAFADDLTVTVDRRWLAVAIRQGIDNAARFSPSGAPIEVSTRSAGGLGVIEVADRGPGVPPERSGEVFSRFARWRPPGYEDRQGSGLGLFICRGILAEHAGDASLEARPEGGTMLRLTIPLSPPPMEG